MPKYYLVHLISKQKKEDRIVDFERVAISTIIQANIVGLMFRNKVVYLVTALITGLGGLWFFVLAVESETPFDFVVSALCAGTAAIWFGRYRNMVRQAKYHSEQSARKPRWQKLSYQGVNIRKAKRIGFEYAPVGLHGPWRIVYELKTDRGTRWCRVLLPSGIEEAYLQEYKPHIYSGTIPSQIANLDPLETGT